MKSLKIKDIRLILAAAAIVLTIVAVIMGSTQHALVRNTSFGWNIIVAAAVSILLTGINLFLDWEPLPLFSAIGYSLVLGFIIQGGAEVINDHMLKINYSGGNYPLVVVYLVLVGLAAVISVVTCFCKNKQA